MKYITLNTLWYFKPLNMLNAKTSIIIFCRLINYRESFITN